MWDTHVCWLSAEKGYKKGQELSGGKHLSQGRAFPSTAKVPAPGRLCQRPAFPCLSLSLCSLFGAHLEIIEKDKMTLICYQLEETRILFSNLWLLSIHLKTPREVIGIITAAPEYSYYALELGGGGGDSESCARGLKVSVRHQSPGCESHCYPGRVLDPARWVPCSGQELGERSCDRW